MSRRGLIIALVVSLVVNLFVLGGVAGALLLHGRHPHGRVALMRGPMMAAAEALTPEHRQAWAAAMRAQAGSAGPGFGDARRLRREAFGRLAADPVDSQAVLADLDRSRALEQQARAAFDRRIVDFAATLPPDERRRFAEALARPRPPRGPGPMMSGGGGPGPGERRPDLPDR